ncbi:NPC1-like intracellular cholesterol transporter 1 [Ornithodoros turicata]|uniref:NPC1-like intracellular cholesterol transporter 1 n=1 Tax=Ornithodoros turicata TaxID=34597 RepID=UPI0031399904
MRTRPTFTMSRLVFLALVVCLASNAAAKCVMRSTCDKDETRSACVFDGEAQTLATEESRSHLVNLCGDIFPDPYAAVCCSDDQVQEFSEQIESAVVLGLNNCPACGTNFRNLICNMVCSPEQHEFIELLRTGVSDDGEKFVQEFNYHVNPVFVRGMFNACANAKSRIASVHLLNFMCGRWGSDCTAERWLQFLGATPDNGGLSPMQINYVQSENETVTVNGTVYRPMNVRPYRCDTEDTTKTCSCQHCPASCPAESDKKENGTLAGA